MSTSNETPEAPVTVSTNDAVVSPPVTTNEFAAVEDKPETTEIAPATTDNDTATATAPVNDAEGIAQKGKQKETLSESVKEQDDAIGPAQDEIKAPTSEPNSPPVCNITLLLTTGSRHPYKLDAKYLTRRNVAIPENTEQGQPDPFSISIYTLKELILREWRSDWEAKPASPSSIRLIHFGKLLDDKEPLRKYQFSTEAPNVVHMSIRPSDLDEEEPKSGSKALGGGLSEDGTPRSRGLCCVIL